MAPPATARLASPEDDKKRKRAADGSDSPKRPCTRSGVRVTTSRDAATTSSIIASVPRPRIRMYFKDFYPAPFTSERRNGIRFYRRNFFNEPRMIPTEEVNTERKVSEDKEARRGEMEWIESEDGEVKEEVVEIKREEVDLEQEDGRIKKEENVDAKEEVVNAKKEAIKVERVEAKIKEEVDDEQ